VSTAGSGLRPALGPRGREALIVLGALPLLALAGVAVASAGAGLGLGKLLFVLLALAGALASLADIRVALGVLVLMLGFPLRTKLLFDLELHTTHLLLAMVAAQVVAGLYFRRLVAPRGLVAPVSLLLFGAVVASVAGPDPGGSLFRAGTGLLLPLLAGVGVALALDPRRDLRTLSLLVSASLAGTSLLVLAQVAGRVPESIAPVFEADRVNGLFFHPNILGGFLAAELVLLVGIASYGWQRFSAAPLVFGAPIFLGVAALGVTLSRGALLGLAVGVLVVMALLVAQRQALAVVSVVFVVAVTLVLALPQVPESNRAAFAERIGKVFRPGAESGRTLIYRQARVTIGDYPLTGIGPLTFGQTIRRDATVAGIEPGLLHAHNLLLETWLSVGPLGLMGLLWLLVGSARRMLRAAGAAAARADPVAAGWAVGALGSLASMLTHGQFDFLFWQPELLTLFLVVLGSGYALARAPRNEDDPVGADAPTGPRTAR